MSESFWLYQWMDERGVSSVDSAERLLRQPKELAILHERAAGVPYTTEPIDHTPGDFQLIGGRGIDLSGELDCFAWPCRKKQVDFLLARIWHYFDRVVVVGPGAFRVAQELEGGSPAEVSDRLVSDIRMLLYLREIGAEPLLLFRQKPPACEVHVAQHAEEAGLVAALGRLDAYAEQLARESKIETQPHDDHVHYTFVHPRFEHTVWGVVEPAGGDLNQEIARAVLDRYMAHLTSDVRAARMLGLPLASTVQLHGDLLGMTPQAPSAAQVMFDLELPVVDGLDIKTLIRLREEEREHFERFRIALRVAANARLDDGDGDPAAAALKIQQEVIDPALSDINVRLKVAAEVATQKTRGTTRLGAALIACGVYFGEPTITAAGIVAAGASVQATMKKVDDVGQARLSDMFFLWQAQEHAH
jgi:hypothetical protein